MTSEASSVIAIDIGGTTIKGAVFDGRGAVIARIVLPTFARAGHGDAQSSASTAVAMLIQAAGERGATVEGIGAAVPGLVDTRTGVVAFAANLRWDNFPLKEHLQRASSLPVFIDHDSRAGALAEIEEQGAAVAPDGTRNLLFVPIGTGVAAAIVANGMILRGATGAAGEFGHSIVVPDGVSCACGQRGCLEAYASGASILRRYHSAGGTGATTTAGVISLIGADPLAARVWNDAISALASGLAMLTAVLDPQSVIIGGGLSLAKEALLLPLRSAVRGRLPWRDSPTITGSVLGADSALVGAALLGWAAAVPEGFVAAASSQLRLPNTRALDESGATT